MSAFNIDSTTLEACALIEVTTSILAKLCLYKQESLDTYAQWIDKEIDFFEKRDDTGCIPILLTIKAYIAEIGENNE